VFLVAHLRVDRLGDVVVPAPVGGALGVGELVQVVPAALPRNTLGLGVHLTRVLHEMATPALGFDERDLGGTRSRGHHGDERQTEQDAK
jgi:hypothetical protein